MTLHGRRMPQSHDVQRLSHVDLASVGQTQSRDGGQRGSYWLHPSQYLLLLGLRRGLGLLLLLLRTRSD